MSNPDRLTGLDASFLALEKDGAHMHVGSVLLFAGRMDEGWRLLEGSIERATRLRFEGQAARSYRMIGPSATST